MSAHSSAKRLQDVFSNPVLALLLWTCAVNERVDQELCRLLGLRDVDLETLEAVYGGLLKKLRALRVSADDCKVDELGQALKTHLGAELLQGMLQQRPEQMEYSARLLTRLPLWIRDPQLASLEREVRISAAEARIEEVNLRRAETAARRLAVAPASVPESSVPAAPASVPESSVPESSAPANSPASASVGQDSVPASLGQDSVPASVGRDSVSANNSEVKSDPPETLKVVILGRNPAEQIKTDAAEPAAQVTDAASALSAPRPQTGTPQGRRKLPKAARKAAVAAGRR